MKNYIQLLNEFTNLKVPMAMRKSSDGSSQIFCPHCGKKILYLKKGSMCRHCEKEVTYNPDPVFQKDKVMINY